MDTSENNLYAVITGDIVASSRLSGEEHESLHRVMQDAYSELAGAFPGAAGPSIDIFRGDSWQMVILEPAPALRCGLFYRALLRAKMQTHQFNTRMAVGVGHVSSVPDEHISRGSGEAYERSGQALDSMHGPEALRVVLPEEVEAQAVATVVCLLDERSSLWTDKQALAVTGVLRGWTQKETAEKLWPGGISQSGVSQHLDRAGWHAVAKGIEFVEEEMKDMLQSPPA
jgi:hypothetical protein